MGNVYLQVQMKRKKNHIFIKTSIVINYISLFGNYVRMLDLHFSHLWMVRNNWASKRYQMVRTAEFGSELGEDFPNSTSYKSDCIFSNILFVGC